ncbi:MAG: DUF11 domain-containing protein, partial [Actinobacteria bacterium]|nr:DUF11 domain-containing protein [Actinomycetota bacterium]
MRKSKLTAHKILMLTVLSILLILTVATAYASGTNCKLEGWDIALNKWSTGNITGYSETEYIPARISIDDLAPNTTYTVTVSYDRIDSAGNLGITDIQESGSYYSKSANRSFNFGATNATILNVQKGTTNSGKTGYATYTFKTASAGPKVDVQITFGAYLAEGAHNWNGATLHLSLSGGCTGQHDLPIVVNKIIYHDLSINKEGSGNTFYEGSTVTYTIKVANRGNTNEAVTVKDQIPSGLNFIASSANPAPYQVTTNTSGTLVEWRFTISPNTTVTITYQAV